MIKARLKIDVTETLKEGTELIQQGAIFYNDKTCFTADLVLGNPNFELIEVPDNVETVSAGSNS